MKKMQFGKKIISTENCAFIMGIVNCTPDSFYAGSRGGIQESIDRAMKLIQEGADVLDLGAESTRPGSMYVDESEEIERLIPVLKEIRRHSDIPISIDTRKSVVMQAAFDHGADVLNDVSALEDDACMAETVVKCGGGVILMHKKGNPAEMQNLASYTSVFDEVSTYLEERAAFAMEKGIPAEKIMVDPGIGFAKNLEQNIELVKRCGELCGHRFPVLMALSRKSFLGKITGQEAENRLSATIAADLVSVMKGADMVRVHDVLPCRDSLMVLQSLCEV